VSDRSVATLVLDTAAVYFASAFSNTHDTRATEESLDVTSRAV